MLTRLYWDFAWELDIANMYKFISDGRCIASKYGSIFLFFDFFEISTKKCKVKLNNVVHPIAENRRQ